MWSLHCIVLLRHGRFVCRPGSLGDMPDMSLHGALLLRQGNEFNMLSC